MEPTGDDEYTVWRQAAARNLGKALGLDLPVPF
jgi:hypothetical protein